MSTDLQYLSHEAIDLGKWDQCIAKANNGSVYAFSSLLNHMSPDWEALILGDYEAVMPLTWKKKMMISYLCQPAFLAEGGVFSEKEIQDNDLDAFLEAIPERFKLWEFSLNSGNPLHTDKHQLAPRINYLLNLDRPYEELQTQYSANLERNLNKASKEGLRYDKDISAGEVIALAQKQLAKLTKLSNEDFRRFTRLCGELAEVITGHETTAPYALARGVVNDHNQLLASAIFLFSHGKAYYALVGNASEGRAKGASHLLLDRFIEEFAETGITLDFEGSDIPSLERFYQSFGAQKILYPAVRLNRLPWPVKWLK